MDWWIWPIFSDPVTYIIFLTLSNLTTLSPPPPPFSHACTHSENTGTRNKLALVQYSFNGPEIQVRVKPHGNSKSDAPFLQTSDSAWERIRDIAASERPKSAIFTLIKEAGGEVEVASTSMLPRNRQQISNIRRSHCAHDKNVLYSVMLECKLTQGKDNACMHLWDVKAAPSQSILFFDWQLRDM